MRTIASNQLAHSATMSHHIGRTDERQGEAGRECQPAIFDVTELTLSGIYSRVHIPI